jgi:hypothetical protein
MVRGSRRTIASQRWHGAELTVRHQQTVRIVEIHLSALDVTENTRLYRDLAEREAKIRRLVEANIIGVFTWQDQ